MRTHATTVLAVLLLTRGAPADESGKRLTTEILPRVSLGMAVEELPNVGPFGGVMVTDLAPEGPAARSGLKKGDVIVRVSNRVIENFDEFVGTLAGHGPGDTVNLTVVRGQRPQRIKVTLAEPGKDGDKAVWKPEGCQSCAFLGVLTTPVDALSEDTLDRLGVDDQQGVLVLDVVPGSAAAKAGLRHGDLITAVDGKEIDQPDDLRLHVRKTGEGKEMTLTVQRGEQTRAVKATPGKGPCDVYLSDPDKQSGKGGDASKQIERLERRIERLEQRLQEMEQKRGNP